MIKVYGLNPYRDIGFVHIRSLKAHEFIDNNFFFLPFVFPRQQACKPLDIPSLLADSMGSQPVADKLVPRSHIYWKLIISLPEGCEERELIESDRGRFMSFVIRKNSKEGCIHWLIAFLKGSRKRSVCVSSLLTLYISPNMYSDQHQISPCNINVSSTPEVMRIKDTIIQGESS